MANSKDLKDLLVRSFPATKTGEWKRTGKISGGIGTVRTFENKAHQLEINTLEDLNGNISIMGPVVKQVPPPGGAPTWEEIRSGRVKII